MEMDAVEHVDESDNSDGTDKSESTDPRRFKAVLISSLQEHVLCPRFHFSARTPFFLLRPAWTRFILPVCFLIQWYRWCSSSVNTAEGVCSWMRAATARPQGPAPTMITSWIVLVGVDIVELREAGILIFDLGLLNIMTTYRISVGVPSRLYGRYDGVPLSSVTSTNVQLPSRYSFPKVPSIMSDKSYRERKGPKPNSSRADQDADWELSSSWGPCGRRWL